MMKRIVSLLLCFGMVLTMAPIPVYAAGEDSLCAAHHPEHTTECGYTEQTACSLYPCAVCAAEKAAEEEAAKKKAAEEEAAKKAAEEEAAKKAAAEEAARKASEAAAKVKEVQAIVDALPDKVTQENKAAVGNQLNAVIKAVQSLEESLQPMVNLSKYELTLAAMYALEGQAGAQNPQTTDPGRRVLHVWDDVTYSEVSKDVIKLTVYGTKNGTVQVGSYDNLLDYGMEIGKSYSVSLPENCGYELYSHEIKLNIPDDTYYGDIGITYKIYKQYDLTVTVKDSLGDVIANATVAMKSPDGTKRVTTDSSGKATFKWIRGLYTVTASAEYTDGQGNMGTAASGDISMRNGNQNITLTIPRKTKVSVKVSGLLPGNVGSFDSDVSNATVTVKNKNGESVTLTRQPDGTYVGDAIRTAKGTDTFTVTVNAKGYHEKSFTVSSSGGAAISTSTELTMVTPTVTGLTNGQQLTVAEAYPVTIDLNSVPEDAILSLTSNNDKFRITGTDGSWKVYPVDAGSAEIEAGIGSNPSDPSELPVLYILNTYNVTAARGTVAPPAAPALSGSADNATSETFTLPGDLKLAEKVTIRAQGGGVDKTEVYSGITAGQSLTMDFGKVIRGQVNYTYTYESSKTGYSGPAANSKGYYVLLDPSSVTFSHGSTIEYNGQQQVPTVSVAGLSEDEYTVSYGSVVGADTQFPLYYKDNDSFCYPNGIYEFTYTFVFTNTTKPLYYYVEVLGNEAQYIKGGVQSLFQITKRNLTITAQDQAISAGESIDDSKVTIGGSGLASGHKISYTLTPTTTAPGTKGALEISNVKVMQGNTDVTGYYNITINNGELINKVSASAVTVELPESVTYNGAPQKPAVLKVGDKVLTEGTDYQAEYTENQFVGTAKVTFTSDCWEGESIEKSFEIVKKPLTASISDADKIYNGSKQAENAKLILSGIVGEDDVKATAAIAYADANAGTNKNVTATGITLTGGDAKNYKLVDASGKNLTTLEATGTISRRPVTIIPAADQSKIYGEEDPVLGYNLDSETSLVSGETLSGQLGRQQGADVGTYQILQGTLTNENNPNYDISFLNNVTFGIEKRKVTITGITAEKVYDGSTVISAMDVEAAVVNNLAAGENLTVIGAAGSFENKNAGTNVKIIFAVDGITLAAGNNAKISNYEIDYSLSAATGTIRKLAVTITPDGNQGKTYGDAEPVLTYTKDVALIADETLTAPLVRETGENAGEYGISLAAESVNPNYALTLAEGTHTFTIDPLEITETNTAITVSNPAYSGKTWTVNPVVKVTNGQAQQVTAAKDTDYTVTGNRNAAVGTYTLTVTGKGNYTGSVTAQWKILPDQTLLEDVLDGTITADNVSITRKEDLENLKDALDSVNEDTVATDEEKQSWEDALEKLPSILQKLEILDKELNTEAVKDTEKTTPENATVDQKEDLEKAKEDIQDYLDKNGSNITGDEKTALEDRIDSIDDALTEIEKAESNDTYKEILEWLKDNEAKADADELDMRDDVEDLREKIEKIQDSNTRRIVNAAVDKRLDVVEEKLYTYKIIDGDGDQWRKKSGKNMEFEANGAKELFDYLLIDGKKVASSKYTVSSGSTIVTLKASYLQTLKEGNHTIQFVYDDDKAEDNKTNVASFKILPEPVTPATGDGILLPVLGMLISFAVLVMLLMHGKKRKA